MNKSSKTLLSVSVVFLIVSMFVLTLLGGLVGGDDPLPEPVVWKRTATSDVYRNPDGTYTAKLYSRAVNIDDKTRRFPNYVPFGQVVSLSESSTTGTITLNGLASATNLTFIALNPAGHPMPIQSVIGFNIFLNESREGYKWGYNLKLPNTQFVAIVNITSDVEIKTDANYVYVDGLKISFDDILAYNYTYVLTQTDNFSALYEITKDWSAHGIKNNDPIVIDPTVQLDDDGLDGYVNDASPTSSFSTQTTFYVGCYWDCAGVGGGAPNQINRNLINVSLADINGNVTNTTYYLYISGTYYSSSGTWLAAPISVHRITGGWGSGVTWNNQPSYNAEVIDTVTIPAGSNPVSGFDVYGWYQWDMNETEIGDMASGVLNNYGFIFKTGETTDKNAKIGDSLDGTNTPYLNVEYTPWIDIISPTPSQIFTEDSPTARFNITTNVDMGTCYWSPDGGTTNYTMTKEVAPLNFSNLNNITTNIHIGSDHDNYILIYNSSHTKPDDGYGKLGLYAGAYTDYGGSTEQQARILFWGNDIWQVNAGEYIELNYTSNAEQNLLKVYLPALPSDANDYEFYIATDGSTYNDSALTQIAYQAPTNYWGILNTSMVDGAYTDTVFFCNQSSDGTWRTSDTVSFDVDSVNVTVCRDLTIAGRNYTLLNDVITTSTCFKVWNSVLTFDLKGYKIDGDDGSLDIGIHLVGEDTDYHNITIKNGNITDFGSGIKIGGTDGAGTVAVPTEINIENCSFYSNANSINFFGEAGDFSVVSKSTFDTHTLGVKVYSASDVTLVDSTFVNNLQDDVAVQYATGTLTVLNTTYSGVFTGEAVTGVLTRKWYFDANVTNSTGSLLDQANITVRNETGQVVLSVLTNASGDISQTTLIEYINDGGTKTYHTPHEITVTKAGYAAQRNNTNITALHNVVTQFTLEAEDAITKCSVLDQENHIYNLSANIVATADNLMIGTVADACIIIVGSNITLDCGNYNIKGPGSDIGIYNDASETSNNLTIRNCNVTDFVTQIALNTDDSLIENNILSDTIIATLEGIDLDGSRNTIKGNKVNDNTGTNIYAYGISGDNNILINNTANDNTASSTQQSFRFTDGKDNQIINCTSNDNSGHGIYFAWARHTILKDFISNDPIELLSLATNNTFINSTYTTETVDASSILIRKWYLTINVTDSSNNVKDLATVKIYNSTGANKFDGLSGPDGLTPTQTLEEYTNDAGTKTYQTNYMVNVSLAGYDTNSTEVNLTSSMVQQIVLQTEVTDTTAPNVTLVYPANSTYQSVVELNYTTNDAQTCWYSTDGGTTNTTVTCGNNVTGLSATEGTNTWVIGVNDTNNNKNQSSVTFFIDTLPPEVTVNQPLNQTYAIASIDFNVTTNENTTTCWFTLDAGINNYTLTNNGDVDFNYTNVSMGDGAYTTAYYCNDTLNNLNNTATVSFGIDTTIPVIAITDPANNTNHSINTVTVNYTISDTNLNTCWYTNDSGTTNNTITCGNNLTTLTWNEGINNVTIYANDSANNLNSSYVFFTVDTTAPNATLLTPANNTATPNATTNFTANLTDNLGIKNATLYIYNTTSLVNETTWDYAPSTPSTIIGIVVTLIDEVYNWFYSLFDWSGNQFNTENNTLTVDTTIPVIAITDPANNTNHSINTVTVNYTISDTNLNTCWYTNDSGTTNHTLTCGNNLTTLTWNEGINNVTIYANDSANNLNSSYVFFTVDTTSPSIVIAHPLAASYALPTQSLNYTISDGGVGANTCWYSNDTGTTNHTFANCGTNATLIWEEGSNTVYIWANDTLGNEGSTSVTFSISTTAPSVALDYPVDNQWFNNGTNIYFNFTATDATLETCELWANWTGIWSANYTWIFPTTAQQNFTTQNVSEGNYIWGVWCNDTANNGAFAIANRTVNIDTTIPVIAITDPANNTNHSINTVNVNYTVSDLNLQACWYTNDSGTTNNTITCGNNLTTLTWNEGINNVTIYANDSANNLNSSYVFFTVDSTRPSLTITAPENIFYKTATLDLNYTASDTNLQACWYSNDTGTTNHTFANCGTNATLIWEEGSNTVYIWANDSLGNINNSESITFIVDTTIPVIAITDPANNTNHSINTVTVNYTISDTNLNTCWYTNDSGTTNHTLTCGNNLTTLTWNEGINNVTIYANDSANNLNSSYVFFTVDTTAPNATLLNPLNATINSTTVHNFTANLTDNLGIKNATLYIYNTTSLVNETTWDYAPSTPSTIIGIVVTLIDEVYNWFYSLFDWSGNQFNTENNTLTVDTTPPFITITSPLNQTYTTFTLTLSVSATESINTYWYSFNSGTTNTTFTTPTSVTASAGSNTIRVYANDTSANLNYSEVTFYVNYTDRINITLTTDKTTQFGANITMQASTVTNNTNLTWCNFSLQSPSAMEINFILGSSDNDLGSEVWNSTYHLISETGTYSYNVTCQNEFGTNNTVANNFNVTYNMVASPTNYSFASRVSSTEENNITVYMYDTVTTKINYTIIASITNSTNFTLTYPASITLNSTDAAILPSWFILQVQGKANIPDGIYEGNITLNNTLNNNFTYLWFRYGIKPPSGIPKLYTTGDVECEAPATDDCSVPPASATSLEIQQGQSTSYNYKVKNIGPSYDLGNCTMKFTGDFENNIWISNNAEASINRLTSSDMTITVAPTSTTTATTYRGYMYVYCGEGDAMGNDVESAPENRPYLQIQVISSAVTPPPDGGGGGTVEVEAAVNITEAQEGICGNRVCEPQFGENFLVCPEDCEGDYSAITSCFSADAEERKNCIFLAGTFLTWIFGFIAVVVVFLLFFKVEKQGTTTSTIRVRFAKMKSRRKRR